MQVFHWTTNSYALHQATGGFYETLQESTDHLVETWQGRNPRVFDSANAQPLEAGGFEVKSKGADVAKYTTALRAKVAKAHAAMAGKPEMINLLEALMSEIDKFMFLISLKV